MKFAYDDGGRKEAGYKGYAGDCACRAIAIATGRPYQKIYDELNVAAKKERPRKARKGRRSSARNGVYSTTIRKYMASLGWSWVPTMKIGSGCKVHVKADELPCGRLVLALSKHYTAMVDGLIHDLDDPSRDETRCVYGFYYKESSEEGG